MHVNLSSSEVRCASSIWTQHNRCKHTIGFLISPGPTASQSLRSLRAGLRHQWFGSTFHKRNNEFGATGGKRLLRLLLPAAMTALTRCGRPGDLYQHSMSLLFPHGISPQCNGATAMVVVSRYTPAMGALYSASGASMARRHSVNSSVSAIL